jgi:hypothetical protein
MPDGIFFLLKKKIDRIAKKLGVGLKIEIIDWEKERDL